jgi:hypothetical protein
MELAALTVNVNEISALEPSSLERIDYWLVSLWLYVAFAILSFIPVWRATRRRITKSDVDTSVSQARETIKNARPIDDLDEKAREAIALNFERLAGTLLFWKYEAAKYRAAHYYCLFWTIPSAVLIPILTQAVNGSSSATTLVTVISAFTAILLAFHRGLKIEENFRGFRHGESEFYDLFRRILDRPGALGKDSKRQLESYLIETETIRRFVRNAETNNLATLDEARQLLKGNPTEKDHKSPT